MLRNTVDGEFATVGDIVALFVATLPTSALTDQSIGTSHCWHMA